MGEARAGEELSRAACPTSLCGRVVAGAWPALKVAGTIVVVGVGLVAMDPTTMAAYRATAPQGEWANRLAEGLKLSLELPVVVAFIAVYVAAVKVARGRTLWLLAGTMVSQAVLVDGLKMVFGRPRPRDLIEGLVFCGPQLHDGYNSFPSGHACAAVALATVLAALHPRWKWGLYAGALLVMWSRVHLNAHYVGDCWFGGWIGLFLARAWVEKAGVGHAKATAMEPQVNADGRGEGNDEGH